MKAYLIETTQECQELTCMCFSDPKTVRVADVRMVYVPNRFLLGYDAGDRRILLSEKPPFLGVQDIVDGVKKGVVKEIDLNEQAAGQILNLIPNLRSELNKKDKEHPNYQKIESLVQGLYAVC